MAIAGFDPSITHYGWVIFDENLSGKDAVLDFGTFKTEPTDGLLVQRLILQRERVKALLLKHNIKFVSMEAPYFMDFNTELLFALNQFIHEVFLNLGIKVIYIQPQTLKKLAIPGMKSNDITKHHMVHQAKTELDKHGKRFSEHVADAYHAGKIGNRFYKWYILKQITDTDLDPNEIDLFCGKHTFTRGKKKDTTEYTGLIYRENDQFFDYSKQVRKTETLKKEVENG